MKFMKNNSGKYLKSKILFVIGSKKYRLPLFIGIFAFIGASILVFSRAATPTASFEPESGQLANASMINDGTASGGKALQFNSGSEAKFRLFSPGWRGIGPNQQLSAQRFNPLFGQDDDFNPETIRSYKLNNQMYKYTLGPYVLPENVPCKFFRTNPSDPDYNPNITKCGTDPIPDSAIAKDIEGYAVWPKEFPNNFMIVPDNVAWTEYVELELTPAQIKYKNTSTEWDGLFSDSMGSPESSAINPNTGSPYTKQQWLIAAKETLSAKKRALGSKPLYLNGLANGSLYYATTAPTSLLADKTLVDGVMAERIFREPNDAITEYKTTPNWKKDIDMIIDVQNKGLYGYWWSKCWSKEATTTRSCRDDSMPNELIQWRRFAIGSYLLAAGPKSYFSWDEDYNYQDVDGAAEYYPEYDRAILLGNAVGDMAQTNVTDVWMRQFSNGVVLVNPTTATATIKNLYSGSYTDYMGKDITGDGNNTTDDISVPAHSAEILIKK